MELCSLKKMHQVFRGHLDSRGLLPLSEGLLSIRHSNRYNIPIIDARDRVVIIIIEIAARMY